MTPSWQRTIGAGALAVAGALGAVAATGAAPPGDAAGADPLHSDECRRALEALQADEQAAAGAGPGTSAASGARGRAAPDPRLAASRRQAAKLCLASRADPPLPPQRLVRPPIAVAPLPDARPDLPPRPASPALPTPPGTRPADKPYAITSCDAGGCWTNDGSRLNRVGPNLWGPRGVCTVQGSLVQCP